MVAVAGCGATVAVAGPAAASSVVEASETSEVAGCVAAQLTITVGDIEAGLGHRGGPLLFENTGTQSCVLSGYPSVTLADSEGTTIEVASQTLMGYMGGLNSSDGVLPVVVLVPGEVASALVESLNWTSDGDGCPSGMFLLVAVPGDATTTQVAWAGGCSSVQVHPVVAGTTGQG